MRNCRIFSILTSIFFIFFSHTSRSQSGFFKNEHIVFDINSYACLMDRIQLNITLDDFPSEVEFILRRIDSPIEIASCPFRPTLGTTILDERKNSQSFQLDEMNINIIATNRHFLDSNIDIASQEGRKGLICLYAREMHTSVINLVAEASYTVNTPKGSSFSLLHIAAKNNCVTSIENFLFEGGDVNAIDPEGNTPLHIAVKNKQIQTVSTLIKHKAKAHILNNEKEVPLLMAVKLGFGEIVNMIIDEQPRLSLKQPHIRAALCEAVARNDKASADKILNNIDRVHPVTCGNKPIVSLAAMSGFSSLTEGLLQRGFSAQDPDGLPAAVKPIVMATIYNQLPTVKLLQKYGAPLDIKISQISLIRQRTPTDSKIVSTSSSLAHIAAFYGANDVLKYLNDEWPEIVVQKDNEGRLPVHLAIAGDRVDSLNLLARYSRRYHQGKYKKDFVPYSAIDHGASNVLRNFIENGIQSSKSTNKRLIDTTDFLLKAIESSADPAVVTVLVKSGANVKEVEKRKGSILSVLIKKGTASKEMFDMLLANGASPTLIDEYGNEPIHNSILQNAISVIPILRKYGADLDAKNRQQHAPIHLAVSTIDDSTIEKLSALLNNGANINVTGEKEKIVLHYLVNSECNDNNKCLEIIKFLISKGANRGATISVGFLNDGTPSGRARSKGYYRIEAALDRAR